uniref:Uncharacterized protein n=1 Tax=Setaria viridis TaxID=4556 RepID=A0A4U6VJB0_SETVI|nr:hypothetical protein SEVIR_3G337810v2 [Setaria viridis]
MNLASSFSLCCFFFIQAEQTGPSKVALPVKSSWLPPPNSNQHHPNLNHFTSYPFIHS